MSDRSKFLGSISGKIQDYRNGDLPRPTPEHVDRWISQFDIDAQLPMLRELDHILEKTYFSRLNVEKFLGSLVNNKELVGDSPCDYWRKVNFLNIQIHGDSQNEMLAIFNEVLNINCGISLDDCGLEDGEYIYIDDAIFSGSSVKESLTNWIKHQAPARAKVHVIAIALYTGCEYVFRIPIKDAIKDSGKTIQITRWRCIELINQKQSRSFSEVYWPTALPDEPNVLAYAQSLDKYPFEARKPMSSDNKVFSGEEGRHILEQQLLLAGVRIRSFCNNPKSILKPLGFSQFGLGFGATIVTFRNCPNNAPLAFWWGDANKPKSHPLSRWYPLFPRKIYNQEIQDEFDILI